jgi:MFS family permease
LQVIGSVNTVLKAQYGDIYTLSTAARNVSSIAFAGTVVGQLIFGYLSDRWSRSNALLLSTVILVLFTALATGSYFKGEAAGMFAMLTAWRFFVGIGIGGT